MSDRVLTFIKENVRRLVEIAEQYRKRKVSVQLVKDLLFTTTPEMAEALIAQVPEGMTFVSILHHCLIQQDKAFRPHVAPDPAIDDSKDFCQIE